MHSEPEHHEPPLRVHGGIDVAELAALGIDQASVLDASTSVNPYGPAPAVVRAIRDAAIARYPDPACTEARAALAGWCDVAPARVVLGNGATDLLWSVARVLLGPGDAAVVCEPAFSELAAAVAHAGARVVACRAREEDGFRDDPHAAVDLARRTGARAIALCTPASPTGTLVRADRLAALAAATPDVAFVLDQSFLALCTHPEDLAVPMPDNVVCVRSLTKEHAIPGVRVGYLIAAPALAARVESGRPAWTVGSAAQAAAIAAVAADGVVAETRARLLRDAAALAGALAGLGYALLPSETSYFVVRVGDVTAFRRALLCEHRVLVRDCASFGLPEWVRVGARGGDDARRIAAGFAALAPAFASRATRSAEHS